MLPLGHRILHYDTVSSTNDVAWEYKEHGLVITAEEQTAGRGQRGNRWQAPHGTCLMLSLVVQHLEKPQNHIPLSIWAALGVCQCIEYYSAKLPQLKWPNDILLEGKKLSGVLVEQRKDWSVVGVGLNLSVSEEAFVQANLTQAGSLHQYVSTKPRNEEILSTLLKYWNSTWTLWKRGEFCQLLEQWKYYSQLPGKSVILVTLDRTIIGFVKELEILDITLETNGGFEKIPWNKVQRIVTGIS